MSDLLDLPENPVQLATAFVASARPEDIVGISPDDENSLSYLHDMAALLGFVGTQYRVNGNPCLSAPDRVTNGIPVDCIRFGDLDFIGGFASYAKLAGRSRHPRPVRGLCLQFSGVALLPDLDPLPEGHVLHVPVLSVGRIHPQGV